MKLVYKIGAVAIGIAFLSNTSIAFADTISTSTQIQDLLKQIKILQDQLEALNKQKGAIQTEIRSSFNLARQLTLGMSGEDVKTLQELLATDPSIYPEGIVSGYFGVLTAKAVKRFQEKVGLEQVGNVGPKTLERIRQILTEGAGNSGKVPPGLLVAPGILKKLDFTPAPLPGQKLPPGIDKKYNSNGGNPGDTTAPSISGLSVSSIGTTTATISFATNELTRTVLWFGTLTPVATSTAGKMEINIASTTHKYVLTNLASSTTYYYKVEARDASGNTATSTETSFATLAN